MSRVPRTTPSCGTSCRLPSGAQYQLADAGRLQQGQYPGHQGPQERQLVGEPAQVRGELLKAWFGDAATAENEFGYAWLPKVDPGVDYASLYQFDRMYKGAIKGGFIYGHNPAQSMPNTHKIRKALTNLDWLVVGEVHDTETSSFWKQPGYNPQGHQDRGVLLPACQRGEKDGTTSNSGRWHMWHYKGYEPAGDSQSMGWMVVEIMSGSGTCTKRKAAPSRTILNLDWYEHYDADSWPRRSTGGSSGTPRSTARIQEGRPGALLRFPDRRRSTTSMNWLYTGCYGTDGNLAQRRTTPNADAGENRDCSPTIPGPGPSTAASSTTGRPWT